MGELAQIAQSLQESLDCQIVDGLYRLWHTECETYVIDALPFSSAVPS